MVGRKTLSNISFLIFILLINQINGREEVVNSSSHHDQPYGWLQMIKSDQSPSSSSSSKKFVLVHGACHGAWSWYKIVPLLRSSGYNVTAIDLAASGIDPQQITTVRSISDYFRPLVDFMASLLPHERVILVGHSFGGFAISQAMELFPKQISVAVFISAAMIGPSLNVTAYDQEHSKRPRPPALDSRYVRDSNGTLIGSCVGPIFASIYLYPQSPTEDWTLATMLFRPQGRFGIEDMSKEIVVTKERNGVVKRVYIKSEKDIMLNKDFEKWMIQTNPPDEVEEVFGSDHMVMMSKPIELSAHLLRIASKYVMRSQASRCR